MAYRQYIGARYVPKLMDAWNETIDYEPLSVVNDANGNSYTSKKFVPRGTPLSDRTYWMESGNMSGSIIALQNRVYDLERDTAQLGTTKKDKERVLILIGDSFSEGVTGAGLPWATGGGWFNRLITANGLTLGENVFTSQSVTSQDIPDLRKFSQGTFARVLQILLQRMSAEKISKVTDIIVLGGTNDYGAGGTYPSDVVAAIEQGISDFMDIVKTTWSHAARPEVKIGVLMCNTNNTQDFVKMQQKTVRAYKNCQKYGATYILNSEYIMSSKDWISTDGAHPNQRGYDNMERYTNGLISSSHVDIERNESLSAFLTNDGDFNTPSYNAADVSLHNNVLSFAQKCDAYFIDYDIKSPEQKGTSFTATWYLGKINSNLINVNGYADKMICPIFGTVLGTNQGRNVAWNITCGQLLFINNGEVHLRIYATGADESAVITKLILTPIVATLISDEYTY